ncbi:hypothetical protein ACFQ1S_02545 [Kibdelosporangium lantanae]|uniref:Uncharacterized protein n=1 Tax=Kibdelosporangium lantanae TaxID=1497396 RepID=A0ABW3M4N5_9PSEU
MATLIERIRSWLVTQFAGCSDDPALGGVDDLADEAWTRFSARTALSPQTVGQSKLCEFANETPCFKGTVDGHGP